MPPKASKRARSPDTVTANEMIPITWDHSPSDVAAWKKAENSLLYLDLHSDNAHTRACEAAAGGVVKVAGFDMDDTIVFSKSGKVFAQGRDDWKFLHHTIPAKLQTLHKDGFRIVFFTNQSGIGGKAWDEGKANDIRGKITDIGNALSIPISAWIAAKEDNFRKPGLGMWEHFTATLPGKAALVDMVSSFYCGDAAGRSILTMAGRKKDFSCSDRKFAINARLPFYTPEHYFLRTPEDPNAPIHWDGPSPTELRSMPTTYPKPSYHAAAAELVVFVGFPGCGKSTFFRRFFGPHGYVHVNRDTLKDVAKCLAATSAALAAGKSVVVDNTNPTADDRKQYVDLAKKHSTAAAPIALRAFNFTASKELAFHMNVVRDRAGISPRVSSVAYNIFKGKYQPPTAPEGFSEIVNVDPVADFTDLPATVAAKFHMLT